MRNVNKIVRNSERTGKSWKPEAFRFLRSYRSTPHTSTGVSPSDLLFKNCDTSRLPKWTTHTALEKSQERVAAINDAKAKASMKTFADNRRRTKPHHLTVGMRVLVKLDPVPIRNKRKSRYFDSTYTIDSINGSMVTASSQAGHSITRNSSFFKCITPEVANQMDALTQVDFSTLWQPTSRPEASPGVPSPADTSNTPVPTLAPRASSRSNRFKGTYTG